MTPGVYLGFMAGFIAGFVLAGARWLHWRRKAELIEVERRGWEEAALQLAILGIRISDSIRRLDEIDGKEKAK